MREVGILMRRELRSYFASPIAYVFGGLFLLVLTYLSAPDMLKQGQGASMQMFFVLLTWVFVVFVPPLTMRLWAEERKMGTLELLMTFPVTAPQVIAAKFFASLLFLAMVLALTFGLPITLSLYGALDWGPVISAYIASLFLAAAYLSVGMFCSSLTKDQLVAMLVALVMILALALAPQFLFKFEGSVPDFILVIVGAISPTTYFESIARGVIDTRDIVFFICFCGFFLYLNVMALQGRRLKG